MSENAWLLREQWDAVRAWLRTERVLDRAADPSGLGSWSVADVVVHLGYGLRMLAEVVPADGDEPIALARYVAGYAPAGRQIAADTEAAAGSLRGRELEGIDEMADEAWRALDAGLPAVVRGRRGPLRADDFVLTRLLELVVHGDDLHRSLGSAHPSPLLPAAVDAVSAALAEGYRESTGRLPAADGLALVRIATGRVATEDPAFPLLS
ncbi:maleylpyruvate isomerase family mycothiol-dependent enzyme [Nocardioides sp. BYT-33-1]|uniref:maleylpyruvate isomerase family mycothiol-dependent enzyme n=1 Tax=Nocardioides sp. BYT-33-1 TaxID=3416952 RepID=UPI003F52E02E